VQAHERSPPPAPHNTAQAKTSQESTRPPLWEMLPAPNRRRLSQLVARVIARHRLLTQKEVPHD
jgi:hypothetical protein